MRLWERLCRLLRPASAGPPSIRDLAARQRQLKTDVKITRRYAERLRRFEERQMQRAQEGS